MHLRLFRECSRGHSWPSVLPQPSPASTCPAGRSSRTSVPQQTHLPHSHTHLVLARIQLYITVSQELAGGFPRRPVVGSPSASAGHMSWIPGPGRFHLPWGNQAHGLQVLNPHTATACPRACALQQEKSVQ